MSLALHLGQTFGFLVVLLGPVPLALAGVARVARGVGSGPSQRVLLFLLSWCFLQACAALLVAGLHVFGVWGVVGVEALLLVFGRAVYGRVGGEPLGVVPPRLGYAEALIAGCVAGVGFAFVRELAACPCTDYDSLAYHLPMVATLVQHGRFVPLAQFSQALQGYYPYTWEAIGALFVVPFGRDLLVILPNLVVWGMLGVAVYAVSRELGAGRPAALGAAALTMTLPIMAQNIHALHVDLALAAFVLTGVYVAILFSRTRHRAYLAVVAAAAGLTASVKFSGLPYALVLLAGTGWVARRGRRVGEGGARSWFGVGAAACSLAIGGFWYARNWLLVDNPFGNLEVRVGPRVVLPGLIPSEIVKGTSLAGVFRWGSPEHWRVVGVALREQLGWPSLVALALGIGWLLVATARAKDRGRAGLLMGMAALAAVLYWTTPYGAINDLQSPELTPWMGQAMRYAFPLLGVLMVAAALGATAVGVPAPVLAAAVAAGAAAELLREGLPYLWVVLLAAWAWLAYRERIRWRLPKAVGVALALLMIVAGTYRASRLRHGAWTNAYGPAAAYLETSLRPDDRLGYLLSHRSYVFYGERLNNGVTYTPWDSFPRFDDWLSSLRRNHITVVAVGPVEGGMDTKGWGARLEAPGSGLVRVAGSAGDVHLFRLE